MGRVYPLETLPSSLGKRVRVRVSQQKVRSRGREIDVFQHFVDVLVGDRAKAL